MQKAHHEAIKILLRFNDFGHIEKNPQKAVQELVKFCMVFLKINSYKITNFSPWYEKSLKNLAFFLKTPIVLNTKYSLESSRRDLHKAPLCTVLSSQFFVKIC